MEHAGSITLFMCGDVMTGRGIDQILPYPAEPTIHEPYMKSAAGYIELAERVNGPIPRGADFSYIWGDTLRELEKMKPDIRIINLETAITTSDLYWKGKGINYRMNPSNIPCLTVAGIDYCSLANNHTLDWGYAGLTDTLDALRKAHILFAGAGENLDEAEGPAIFEVKGKGRVIILSLGSISSGIPRSWAAGAASAGVNLISKMSDEEVMHIREIIMEWKQPGDIAVVSIHWGGNWGYEIPAEEMKFAHLLIDLAAVDVIHGHSSHHVQGIEIYRHKPILYGCGDFLNDYEGIGGYEDFRGDLGLMYFVTMDPMTGHIGSLDMKPTRIRSFRLNRPSRTDALWLKTVLDREGRGLGTRARLHSDGTLALEWNR